MRSALVFKYPNVQVNLRQLHGVRVGAVKVEAFVVFLPVALIGINHVFDPVLGFGVDAVPAGGELDVDFQFCSMRPPRLFSSTAWFIRLYIMFCGSQKVVYILMDHPVERTIACSKRKEAVSRLVGGPVGLTTSSVIPLAGRGSGTFSPHPRQLLHVAGLHLQTLRKGPGLSCGPIFV